MNNGFFLESTNTISRITYLRTFRNLWKNLGWAFLQFLKDVWNPIFKDWYILRYGTVRYTVKASVFLTLGRVSNSLEEAFYIRALPDPRAPIPLEAELPKVWGVVGWTLKTLFSKIFCKTFRKTQPIRPSEGRASLEKRKWSCTWESKRIFIVLGIGFRCTWNAQLKDQLQ